MKRFYVDLLGFAVEWEPDADNVYLSSGIDNLALHRIGSAPRRHCRAAAATWPSPLDHLGLIVREAEDVDAWAAFLEEPRRDDRREAAHPSRRRALLLLQRSGRQQRPDHSPSADQRQKVQTTAMFARAMATAARSRRCPQIGFLADFRFPLERRDVHALDVFLDHPAGRKPRRDRPDRFLDDRSQRCGTPFASRS